MKNTPPKLFLCFFRWFCHPKMLKYIEGDLMELYEERKAKSGKRKADVRFIIDVLLLFRPSIIKPIEGHQNLNTYGMYKSYFKIGWRNLSRDKGYSFINITGLGLGMAVAMLIGLWIHHELNFDSAHKNKDHIALVMKHTLFNNQKNTQEATPLPLYNELKNNYPEVKRATRISFDLDHSIMTNDIKLHKTGQYVDPDFLEMFSIQLVKGDNKTVLQDPNSIILTESLAAILFGDVNPIGTTIKIDGQYDVQVTGVMTDLASNSSFQFDFLAPFEFQLKTNPFLRNSMTNWGNNMLRNIVELQEGVAMEAFSKKIAPLNIRKGNSIRNQTLFLHPMNKWRLYNDFRDWKNVGGKIEYVQLFAIIGVFVLLIACINFMNLSTARSERRAKEVGIRKTIGSSRFQLVGQFLSESVLTSALAFLFALGFMYAGIPFLEELGISINIDSGNFYLLISACLVCIITGLIAGSYPAFYLSSFRPVKVLKGIFRQGRGPVTFRRVLVVTQFTTSIILICGTAIVFQQIRYAQNRPLGYNPYNLISIESNDDLDKNYSTLKQELLNSGYVNSVAKASSPMTNIYNYWRDFSWSGKDPSEDIALYAVMTEWDYEKTTGLHFKQGRPFSIEHATDSNAVIINEAALKLIGYEDPIGKTMKSGNRTVTIVGVVKDVLMLDPFKPIAPEVILFNANASGGIFIRLEENADRARALTAIGAIFGNYNSSMPFEYSFVNDDFDKKFVMESKIGRLSTVFAALAISISCLGLFGLASFISEQRTKEIGIRKVMGASVRSIWQMLSKDFVVLIILSCAIAIPISIYFMNNWLQQYEYRVLLSWPLFVMVSLGALLITFLTVSYQSIRAAVANPVKSLKSE